MGGINVSEARSVNWQFAFEERPLASNGYAQRGGDGTHKGFGLNGVHEADLLHVVPQAVYPNGAVRVQHDFDDGGIVQITADARTQLAAQLGAASSHRAPRSGLLAALGPFAGPDGASALAGTSAILIVRESGGLPEPLANEG
jgi:hypothetical protein